MKKFFKCPIIGLLSAYMIGNLSADIIVVSPTPTTVGTIKFTEDITFTVTESDSLDAIYFVLDDWVTSDGSMQLAPLQQKLQYRINQGTTLSTQFELADNANISAGSISLNDGYLHTVMEDINQLNAGDTITLRAATYTLAPTSGFNPSTSQTFSGNMYVANGNKNQISNTVAVASSPPVEHAPLVLDDYTSSEHLDNDHYTFRINYQGSGGTAIESAVVSNGNIQINPGSISTTTYYWNQGAKLRYPGDSIKIQIIGMGSPAAAGISLDSDLDNPDNDQGIRFYRYVTQRDFLGPWESQPITLKSGETFGFPIDLKIQLLSVESGTSQLRATLSGPGFYTIDKYFEYPAPEIFFGLHSYTRSSAGYNTFDNLEFVPGSYTRWALANGLMLGVNDGMNQDVNSDGIPNIMHFAENSHPLGGNQSRHNVYTGLAEISGEKYFSMTVPVRKGALLSGSGPMISKPMDGIVYKIEGHENLGTNWEELIEEAAPALDANLPPLGDFNDDGEPDWEYRTFRLAFPISTAPKGFMRLVVEPQ